ncbi:lysine--tRNA ligase, putative [Candida dubliniensis CD36]|uniref:Lysyl-tRNA synthetase n=1 Tax=Candida dubliniensis (strain CD36 / ATCC MYA-646 / CBS 7987 / NCPF 3949 / NRRL Y-17841) TaxID=573826 RepID=B9WK70_CANDC|nr:lysine--tRNA ligase, putative [Candida dubliniensis CD36]CAX40722.1 lysine--tRNA ligase, putative [Candida dubliniensis CD36]
MLLHRLVPRVIPRVGKYIRPSWVLHFSTSSDADNLTHENRKVIITESGKNHIDSKYYPSISTVRQRLSASEKLRVKEFCKDFKDVVKFSDVDNNRSFENYLLEGKITSMRKSGKAMYFIDIIQDNCSVQIMATNKLMGMDPAAFNECHSFFKIGDYIAVRGYASRTKTGELTLKLNKPIEMLTPVLSKVPNRLEDRGLINNNRVLNYLVNPDSKNAIIVKSKVIQAIRNFLLDRDFLEVQTPILSGQGTGANATPFVTKFKGDPVHLRVAPELWLKKLVIGGFDRVFEIGSNFRNEGIDMTHNPEFSTCEFYQAYTSLDELMKMTEDMFGYVFAKLGVTNKFPVGNFPKYEFLPTIEQKTGIPITDLTLDGLVNYYKKMNLTIPPNPNPVKLLNNLSERYLESICSEHPNTPVFIYNQPEIMSPLAKSTTDAAGNRISSRFELFINAREMANAYEEENDPCKQLEKFKLQQQMKTAYNDQEMLIPDHNYVRAMEYGLPPTGGWGCGIDRLAMLIAGANRIEDVLTFGTLSSVLKN